MAQISTIMEKYIVLEDIISGKKASSVKNESRNIKYASMGDIIMIVSLHGDVAICESVKTKVRFPCKSNKLQKI